jgi:hypothetical protein
MHYRKHILDDAHRGWLRFVRALVNRLIYQQPEAASDASYLAKFHVKSLRALHAIEHQRDELRQQFASQLQLLEQYQTLTLRSLSNEITGVISRATSNPRPRNFSSADFDFVQRLMTDASVTIKPADKNLGMVLVSTEWYHAQLTRMLQDRVTYEPLRHFAPIYRNKTVVALPKLLDELSQKLKQLAASSLTSLQLWNPTQGEAVHRYLSSAVTLRTCAVPKIYLLIKVHKAAGLSGRPIVPSTRWLTTPASVVADHLLQEVMREAAIPHIVKDTKSFINELESLSTTCTDGVFLTADIASLYTNIDTQDGLCQVRRFLIERQVGARHMELIMSLLEFVMNNSYLTYREKVWHQIDGTAMGTACAPTYANIVVYMREKDVLREMSQHIYLYRRFLDDVFVYMAAVAVSELQARLNGMHPKIRFEFVVESHKAAFLDLSISKGERFQREGRFDLNVHQKKMNLYLYIPYRSFHTEAMKRSFILTELMRYIRNSSSATSYYELRALFWQRLRDRGYPSAFLLPIFNGIFYSDRPFFLWPSAELHNCPQLMLTQPRSTSLLRRLARQNAAVQPSAAAANNERPLVFVIPYSPLTCELRTRNVLAQHWQLVRDALDEPMLAPPIIAYQSATNLVTQLVFQRASRLDRAATAAAAASAPVGSGLLPSTRLVQPTLLQSLRAASVSHTSIVQLAVAQPHA